MYITLCEGGLIFMHVRNIAKVTISFVIFGLSVRPSVRMGRFGSNCTDFHEGWYLIIFRIYVDKI